MCYVFMEAEFIKSFKHVTLFDLLVLKAIAEAGGMARNVDLAEALGVDHTAIIAAIRKLSMHGLVEVMPRRGYRITHKGEAFLREVTERL
jgi:Mn-dependent DtxR family transcriptional regulator